MNDDIISRLRDLAKETENNDGSFQEITYLLREAADKLEESYNNELSRWVI